MKVRSKAFLFLTILTSAGAYYLLGYVIPRNSFLALISLIAVLFGGYLYLARFAFTLKLGLSLALLLRLIFVLATPRLSDDYFRFIWDGTLVIHGQNPYQHLPRFYLEPENKDLVPALSPALFSGLNSPDYYSVYPPVCQGIFALASLIAGTHLWLNCLVMRVIILLAEAGSVFFLLRILNLLGLPFARIWWYAFNPLVIIELTGNLHPEGILIFFLLGGLYFLLIKKNNFSAELLGLAVSVKLWPLMFLPLVYNKLNFKYFWRYTIMAGLVVLTLFLPFLSPEFVFNIFKSINLYFQNFEFNASLYYLSRWLGYQIWGYNNIALIGPLLSLLTFVGIIYLAFRQKQTTNNKFLHSFLFTFTLYLAFATVVHPWYLTTLVAITTLTNWRFPVLWSGLVFLSYATYQTSAYTENLNLVFIEYLGVYGFMAYEWWRNKAVTFGKRID